jgi:2-oxoglutarate/2-oxoacid ferredoxin oxidoreductase subunit alpha
MKDIVIRIGGEGGEGVISCGELLTTALGRSNYEVFTFRTYPAEIKGGPAMFQVRTSDEPVLSQGNFADILVTFNEEAYQLHGHSIHPSGLLVYDPGHYKPEGSFEAYGVPLEEITLNVVKSKLGKNVVALGAIARILGLSLDLLDELLKDRFGKKGDVVVGKNKEALRAGYSYVDQHPWKKSLPTFPARESSYKRVVMSGNEALSVGAISAGCRYYAGYPITPASDILEFMERDLPKFGGAVVQTEDEIAAIASVVGASYSGKKAMTATAGPGLSLMVEVMGLATMAEIPCVIVDAQRAGPSTGMPTKMEQGDFNLAAFGVHGDAPRIVLAPGDVEECMYYMIHAFNLAEKYQVPVLYLTDQSLAHRTQTFPWPDFKRIPVINRLTPTEEDLKEYKRYKLTPNGVSPMAIPGTEGGCYAATGLEHTERGTPNFTSQAHEQMSAKRALKIKEASKEPGFTTRFGPAKAKIGIIGWGSTQGAIREGMELAAAEGISVTQLQLKMVTPLPEAEVREFVNSVEKVVVAELNYSGQVNTFLRSQLLLPTISFTKATGMPFYADEILEKLREIAGIKAPAAAPVKAGAPK